MFSATNSLNLQKLFREIFFSLFFSTLIALIIVFQKDLRAYYHRKQIEADLAEMD